ncbi:hypothetical protein Mapa_002567 [Marchantia paleacea]|nr:hypothetical protein Mapa_002567 [Marchantia paleacea]
MALQGSLAAVMLSPKVRLSSIHDTSRPSHLLKRSARRSFATAPCALQVPISESSFDSSCSGNEFVKRSAVGGHDVIPRFSQFFSFNTKKVVRRFASASLDSNGSRLAGLGEYAKSTQRKIDLQVVLVSPQIPGNTGCIARTCAAAAVGLHLVEPLGFEINSAKLKRAGLDYWPYVVVKVHSNWTEFLAYFQEQKGEKRLLGFTKKGTLAHTDVKYRPGDWLMFGSETEGIPDAALDQCFSHDYGGGTVRIPIDETYVRCLNLSVAAGIGVYEALRQVGFSEDMLDTSNRQSDSKGAEFLKQDIFC